LPAPGSAVDPPTASRTVAPVKSDTQVTPSGPLAVDDAEGASTVDRRTRTVGTGVFITGLGTMRAGARYALVLTEDALTIEGPVDEIARESPLEYRLSALEVTATNERLILSGKVGRSNAIAVFMAISGDGPAAVAAEISAAQGSLTR
jgi:hypothetical protein